MNWRRYLPAVALVLEGILIGRLLGKVAPAVMARLAPRPFGLAGDPPAPPWGQGCPVCWQREQEYRQFGHYHIPAAGYAPSPPA